MRLVYGGLLSSLYTFAAAKCPNGDAGDYPQASSKVAHSFLKNCKTNFVEEFLETENTKANNVILGLLHLQNPHQWEGLTEQVEAMTEQKNPLINKEPQEELESCVSSCNRADEWEDIKNNSYEENLERHTTNPKRYSKPDYACSKCIKYLPASSLVSIPDKVWGIQEPTEFPPTNAPEGVTTAFGEGTTVEPKNAPGVDEWYAQNGFEREPKSRKKRNARKCACRCVKQNRRFTGQVRAHGSLKNTKTCKNKCQRHQHTKCYEKSCYVNHAQKKLPAGEIKCGLLNEYASSKTRIGQTGLYDPKNSKRFIDGNIVFGNATKIGEIPWQVSFRAKKGSEKDKNFCGGSIVDSQTIVSAAHCFWDCNENLKSNPKSCKFGTGNAGNGFWKNQQFNIAIGFHDGAGGRKGILPDNAKFGQAIHTINLKKNKGKVIIHPDYLGEEIGDPDMSAYNPHDIAVVILNEPIQFPKNADAERSKGNKDEPIGTFVRPVCLPLPYSKMKPKPIKPFTTKGQKRNAETLKISGYGTIESMIEKEQIKCDNRAKGINCEEKELNVVKKTGGQAEKMLKADIGYMDNKECAAYFKEKWQTSKKGIYGISKGQICAKALPTSKNAVDACQGDSGGPLVHGLSGLEKWQRLNNKPNESPDIMELTPEEVANLNSRKWTLVGVTSWGWGCGADLPGVYTRTEPYMDFILKHAKNAQTIDGQILKECN